MLALEARLQMPAQTEEVAEALEEGVVLRDGAMLTKATATRFGGVLLECVRVQFEAVARGGPWTATPLGGTQFALESDAIIVAIGQDPDLGPFTPRLHADRGLLRADRSQATSAERVYAGGDVASMARFVTEAIGMGKRAAAEIDRMLRGAAHRDGGKRAASGAGGNGGTPDNGRTADNGRDGETEPIVSPRAINMFYHPRQARAIEARRAVAERLDCDAEVQLGFDLERALAETRRCFSCGTCTHCDNCVRYCPDLAVQRRNDGAGGGYIVLADYCKGCGICVHECPTGSMKMVEEQR
jgi:Pyruvate/2-oxoacid:ferredoxin oxidoreductase delta subunit